MLKTLPIFFEILTSLQNRSYIATDSLGGTYRVYPRHNIHSGRLLWDCGFENTYFTVLNEFHVENITYFFEVLTSLQNRSYIATGSLGGPTECIQDMISTVEDFCGIADLRTRTSLF